MWGSLCFFSLHTMKERNSKSCRPQQNAHFVTVSKPRLCISEISFLHNVPLPFSLKHMSEYSLSVEESHRISQNTRHLVTWSRIKTSTPPDTPDIKNKWRMNLNCSINLWLRYQISPQIYRTETAQEYQSLDRRWLPGNQQIPQESSSFDNQTSTWSNIA